jgi:Helix-turn-helix domain
MSYKDGLCFPSYETIAEKARCCRDTVYEAILALEDKGDFSWVNRIDRVAERVKDLFGHWTNTYRIVRRSNVYEFRDPLPCAEVSLFNLALKCCSVRPMRRAGAQAELTSLGKPLSFSPPRPGSGVRLIPLFDSRRRKDHSFVPIKAPVQ